jgi:hypothetical protein
MTLQTADTSSQKFGGALLNAVIFAGIMAGMTFILVLLFKYGVSSCSNNSGELLISMLLQAPHREYTETA